jgi:tetratricopeptide (TPR) repeat protein
MASLERYLRLTKLAQAAFSHGRLERALKLFDQALEAAFSIGDRELADRAFCNRCVVLIELDRPDGALGQLKTVLMRSRDPFTAWMAAYYTAQLYEFEDNIGRALAYARRANELAHACGEPRALAASANQHGVLALKDSHFSEAAEQFEAALQLQGGGGSDDVGIAITRDNLGYCLICTGRIEEGLALCRDAAATLEAVSARQFLPEVYQDLCLGLLQQAEFAGARELGERALTLAQEFNHPTVGRNTLMLLADAALEVGDEAASDAYLDRLAVHYPDFRGMKAFLQAFNVREVINLKV